METFITASAVLDAEDPATAIVNRLQDRIKLLQDEVCGVKQTNHQQVTL